MASSRHVGHAGPCLSGRCASARHQGERTSTSRQTCCPLRFPRCAGSSGVSSGPSRPTPSARSPGRTGDDDTSSAPDDHTGSAEPELINPGCSTRLVNGEARQTNCLKIAVPCFLAPSKVRAVIDVPITVSIPPLCCVAHSKPPTRFYLVFPDQSGREVSHPGTPTSNQELSMFATKVNVA